MNELTGDESNYKVLKLIVENLRKGIYRPLLIERVEKFLASKEHIETELDRLTIAARGGDKEAARKIITLLADMNDGQ